MTWYGRVGATSVAPVGVERANTGIGVRKERTPRTGTASSMRCVRQQFVQLAGLIPVVTQLLRVWNELTTTGVEKLECP